MKSESMRVFLTGGTGFVGGALLSSLLSSGHTVVALSRSVRTDHRSGVRWVEGDVAEAGEWMELVDGVDAVCHLAGESIGDRRWNAQRKRRLVDSRIRSTQRIVEAIGAAARRPAFVCASAVGYYGTRGEEELTETSAPGDDFLAKLCVDWEAAARAATQHGVRVANLRFGIVLGRGGGALEKMLPPFRLGLGGPVGPPARWFPWVHLDDAVGIARLALEQPLAGPINVVAPCSARMGEFARALGRALSRPAVLPIPQPLLRIALGEFGQYASPGQRVRPLAASDAGYVFRCPELADALARCAG